MKFLFSGGGTLGPVTPLIAVMEELRARDAKHGFAFVGTPNGPERKLVEAGGFRFQPIASPKLRRYFSLRTLLLPFEFLAALFTAMRIIAREKPDVVIGAGGFTSVPIGIAAKLMGKKLLIHQQDVTPSLSNRILAPLADAMTVNFEISEKDFASKRPLRTGNPVRPIFDGASRDKGLALLNLTGERPVVLAVGGGTGSMFLNELIVSATPLWTGFVDLVHITGMEKVPLRQPGLTYPDRYRRFEFVGEDIAHFYAAADVIISRAGTGTMTELAVLAKPVILIPLADTQQETNARYVVERGGARMFRELDLTPEQLVTFTRDLLKKPEDAQRLGRTLQEIFLPGARQAMADKVMELAGQ